MSNIADVHLYQDNNGRFCAIVTDEEGDVHTSERGFIDAVIHLAPSLDGYDSAEDAIRAATAKAQR